MNILIVDIPKLTKLKKNMVYSYCIDEMCYYENVSRLRMVRVINDSEGKCLKTSIY